MVKIAVLDSGEVSNRLDKKYLLRRDVWIPWDMFSSTAFKKLSAKGVWVLCRFLQKRTWTKGKGKRQRTQYNNCGLVFTYDEAEHLGISQSQFHTIIKRLVEVGFLDMEHQGGMYGHDYSRYKLSERWRDYGTPMFKKVEKKRVLQPGLDVQSWKTRKSKVTTENRSHVTTENRSYSGNDEDLGYRKTVVMDDEAIKP